MVFHFEMGVAIPELSFLSRPPMAWRAWPASRGVWQRGNGSLVAPGKRLLLRFPEAVNCRGRSSATNWRFACSKGAPRNAAPNGKVSEILKNYGPLVDLACCFMRFVHLRGRQLLMEPG